MIKFVMNIFFQFSPVQFIYLIQSILLCVCVCVILFYVLIKLWNVHSFNQSI